MRWIEAIAADAVIAEFLRSEFYSHEFDGQRDRFAAIVNRPNLGSALENDLRRRLLLRRRRHVWSEIPEDTRWAEVELAREDLSVVRIFPRGNLARLAAGRIHLLDFAEAVRRGKYSARSEVHAAKIRDLAESYRRNPRFTTVVLIAKPGRDLSILEGNHRMAAALLAAPHLLFTHFRYFCGTSPHMDRCIWYQNTVANLCTYAVRRMWRLFDRHELYISQEQADAANDQRNGKKCAFDVHRARNVTGVEGGLLHRHSS